MLVVNNTDLLSPDWRFLEPLWTMPGVRWDFCYGIPGNAAERLVRRPNLARYRAAVQTVRRAARAGESALIVSHLPSMAAPTNALRRVRCPGVPQIAFAFNFTALPAGARLTYFRRALRGIDEYVIFSEMERDLYADRLDLPPERLKMLHWAMEAPQPGPTSPVAGQGPYLCAIGGEARDYALLARAMCALPETRMVVVARPYSVAGIEFPANVQVFTNLPAPVTWRIAADSLGMAIPLRDAETPCGHVTMVGAQLLGVPLVVTRSRGVADYASDESALMVPAGDADALAGALASLRDDRDGADQRATTARRQAETRSSLDRWVGYFEEQIATLR